jgi:hypothetical protein
MRASFRATLKNVKAGDTLKIAPGEYPGGHSVREIENLTIEALDPKNPPRFAGGKTAFQFSRCPRLTLRHLKISGQILNGLNLDDGGLRDQPVAGITLEKIEVSEIGPTGNHDGIKCSGLTGLTIRDSTISGWGGQGIDFVGCHESLITGCHFLGKDGFSATSGIQLKGGTSGVTVEKCHFIRAGDRPHQRRRFDRAGLFSPRRRQTRSRRDHRAEQRFRGKPVCDRIHRSGWSRVL